MAFRGRFHIHYRRYNGGGASLKRRLEKEVCSHHGWRNFHECGTGKAGHNLTFRSRKRMEMRGKRGVSVPTSEARYFSGYPAVFREVMGQYGGHLANVGVTVWPGACGHGVIVLATTHCSIEHSISAR